MALYRKRDGITLVEVVVTMGLVAVVLGVLGMASNQLSGVQLFVTQELENRQGLEQVFQTFTREVRSIGPSSVGGYPVELASSSTFTFFSDTDGDGLFERLRYTITSSTLSVGTTKPTGSPLVYATSTEVVRTLVSGVIPASSTFRYYGASYTGTEAPLAYPVALADVRLVSLEVYADLQPRSSPSAIYFSRIVSIRNLRSN